MSSSISILFSFDCVSVNRDRPPRNTTTFNNRGLFGTTKFKRSGISRLFHRSVNRSWLEEDVAAIVSFFFFFRAAAFNIRQKMFPCVFGGGGRLSRIKDWKLNKFNRFLRLNLHRRRYPYKWRRPDDRPPCKTICPSRPNGSPGRFVGRGKKEKNFLKFLRPKINTKTGSVVAPVNGLRTTYLACSTDGVEKRLETDAAFISNCAYNHSYPIL